MLLDDQELNERIGRIESLLGEIESFTDPEASAKAGETVQTLLEVYGEGLARVMDLASRSEDGGLREALMEDELISHLLLLHDLHPVDVHTRVHQALDEVRPYLGSHGGDVEFLCIEDDVVKLRLQGSCSDCPSSTMTLKLAIEESILKAAPELEGVEAEGATEPQPQTQANIVAGPSLSKKKKKKQQPEGEQSSWTTVDGLPDLSGGGRLAREVSGEPVLFLKPEDTLYAYCNLCPGCGETMEEGSLEGEEISCPGCGQRYDVGHAGRGLDSPDLHLEPVPLLAGEEGTVKVALPSAVS